MKIFVDGHLNSLNGIDGIFGDNGYSVITKENGEKTVINYIKKKLTNNEAELIAIFHGCVLSKEEDEILTDSQAMMYVAKSGFSKEPRLQLLAVAVKYLLDTKKLRIGWVDREHNLST